MSDSDRNQPKPLPDDFGLTLPNVRLPKSNAASSQPSNDFDLTQPNFKMPLPNQRERTNQREIANPNDFDLTAPNYRLQQSQQSQQPQQPPPQSPPPFARETNFDLTNANVKPAAAPPSRPTDFGMTLTDFSSRSAPPARPAALPAFALNPNQEPDFNATMPYVSVPLEAPSQTVEPAAIAAAAVVAAPPVKTNRAGLWWLLGGIGALTALAAVALIFLFWRADKGLTLVVKGAPAGSAVFIDNARREVGSSDGSLIVYGISADKPRAVRVAREGYTDFNEVIEGENGERREVIAQMRKIETAAAVAPVKTDCADDPRVCAAEQAALDALDKLTPPFTADDLVKALNLQIINFESGKYDLPPARLPVLQKAAGKFKQIPATSVIEIGGHTDNQGNDQSNLVLSNSRAIAVRAMLVAFGVNNSMLTPRGYGKARPKTSNDTEENRFQNRRIEYTVLAR